jgi:hypothetical protein
VKYRNTFSFLSFGKEERKMTSAQVEYLKGLEQERHNREMEANATRQTDIAEKQLLVKGADVALGGVSKLAAAGARNVILGKLGSGEPAKLAPASLPPAEKKSLFSVIKNALPAAVSKLVSAALMSKAMGIPDMQNDMITRIEIDNRILRDPELRKKIESKIGPKGLARYDRAVPVIDDAIKAANERLRNK